MRAWVPIMACLPATEAVHRLTQHIAARYDLYVTVCLSCAPESYSGSGSWQKANTSSMRGPPEANATKGYRWSSVPPLGPPHERVG